MSEASYSPEQLMPNPQETGYKNFINTHVEKGQTPETTAAFSWYKERVASLSEMKTTDAPLTDGEKWKHSLTPDGQVKAVENPAFFKMTGRRVETPSFSWTQPGIIAQETSIELPTPNGKETMNVSGFVGMLRDTEGNMLLTVGQEPLAQTDKKALVRTPFQTSAGKLQGLMEGNRDLDPNLATILEKVGEGKPISEMFASGEVETFPLAPADPNRIEATNIGFSMTVKDESIKEELAKDGTNRWCTPQEAKALIRAGVVNGHTAALVAAL